MNFRWITILTVLFSISFTISDSIAQSGVVSEIDSLLHLGDSLKGTNPARSLETLQFAESKLSQDLDPRVFIDTYLEIGQYYFHTQDFRSSLSYHQKAIDLKDKVSTIEMSLKIARAYNDIGILYYNLNELENALESHRRSILIYEKQNDFQGLAWNYNNLGILYKEVGKQDSAIYSYEKSLESATEISDSLGIGYNSINIGILYHDQGKFNEALKNFQYARKFFKSPENDRILATTMSFIASVYIKYKEYDLALNQYQSAVLLHLSKGDKRGLANTYEKISELYINQNALDSAKTYASKSLILNDSIGHLRGKGDVLLKLSNIAEREKEFNNSLSYALEAYQIFKKSGNESSVASAGNQIADVYIDLKKYPLAITFADEALRIGFKESSQVKKSTAYKNLFRAHRALGDSKKALDYLTQHLVLQDSIYNHDKTLEFARLEAKFATEKEKELLIQQQEKAELQYLQERKTKQWTLVIGILVVVILVVFLGAIFILYRSKKKHNLELEKYNHELESKNRQLEELREMEKKYLNEKIQLKDRELAALAMNAHEKNSVLTEIENLISYNSKNTESSGITQIQKLITTQKRLDNSWDTFSQHFEQVHPQFFENLKNDFQKLTVNDLKLCAYIKVGMNNKDIAQLTSIELSSIKKSLNRLKKKIDLKPEDSLRDFILSK